MNGQDEEPKVCQTKGVAKMNNERTGTGCCLVSPLTSVIYEEHCESIRGIRRKEKAREGLRRFKLTPIGAVYHRCIYFNPWEGNKGGEGNSVRKHSEGARI